MIFSFEGIDGVGKSTIINSTCEILKNKYDVIKTSLPNGTLKGQEIFSEFKNENISDISRLKLFEKTRQFLNSEILSPNKEKIILIDRYFHSMIAYNTKRKTLSDNYIQDFINICDIEDYQIPKIVFYITCDQETRNNRINIRDNNFIDLKSDSYFKIKDSLFRKSFLNSKLNDHIFQNKRFNIVFIENNKSINDTVIEIIKHIEMILCR